MPESRLVCDCGRSVPPDMLLDISAMPASLRQGRTRACDVCRERWRLLGLVTHASLARLCGEDDAQVVAIAAKHGEPVPGPAAAIVATLAATVGAAGLPTARRARVVVGGGGGSGRGGRGE